MFTVRNQPIKDLDRVRELLPGQVFLHIGMSKAGSTAIQNAFEKNYSFLLDRGLLFPKSVFSRRNPYNPERTSGHLQLIRDIRSGSLGKLISELESLPQVPQRVVLSAENIFSEINDQCCNALAELLRGKSIELFCILRSQLDWCASRYYESVVKGKHKEKASFSDFVERLIATGRLNYYDRLMHLSSVFGAEQITAVDYDDVKKSGGAVQAMLHALGVRERLPESLSTGESNVSHPYPEAIEAHRLLNTVTEGLTHEDYLLWCSQMETAAAELRIQRGVPTSHIGIGRELRERILEATEEQNRLIARSFLQREHFGPKCSTLLKNEPTPLDRELVGELVRQGIALLAPFSEAAGRRLKEQQAAIRHLKARLKKKRKEKGDAEAGGE